MRNLKLVALVAVVLAASTVRAGDTPRGDDVPRIVQEERAAEAALAVGVVRLGLLKVRARVAQGKLAAAVAVGEKSLEAARGLPESSDRASLVESLEAAIAVARSARAKVPTEEKPALTLQDIGDAGGRNDPARPATGYFPDWKSFSIEDAAQRRQQREAYRADLERTYRADEADVRARFGEARRIPSKILVYPDDWAELTKRRAKYDDGIIYAGPEFRTEDGELKRTVVYDIRTLLTDVPRFTGPPELDLETKNRSLADRAALRWSSEIFTGYAHELAAGIELLRYFGGVDESYGSPDQGEAERAELMRLVQQVLEAE